MAMCRDVAMFPGPFPLRRRIGSSWSTTSRTRRARTARAEGIEGGKKRTKRRAMVVLPPRSTPAMAMAFAPGKRGPAGARRSPLSEAMS